MLLFSLRSRTSLKGYGPGAGPDKATARQAADRPARKSLTKAQKAAILFPGETQELITGMLIGDSCLELPSGCNDARMAIKQKDKEFVDHLYDIVAPLGIIGSGPKEFSYYDKRTGKTSIS